MVNTAFNKETLPTLQDSSSDFPGITNVLQEEGILSDARSTKSLTITSHRNHQLVVIEIEYLSFLFQSMRLVGLGKACSHITLARRVQWSPHSGFFDFDSLLVEVHIISPSLEEFNSCEY